MLWCRSKSSNGWSKSQSPITTWCRAVSFLKCPCCGRIGHLNQRCWRMLLLADPDDWNLLIVCRSDLVSIFVILGDSTLINYDMRPWFFFSVALWPWTWYLFMFRPCNSANINVGLGLWAGLAHSPSRAGFQWYFAGRVRAWNLPARAGK